MNPISLRIRWRTFGPNKQYNIYCRRDDESIFTKANALPLNDDISGNIYDLPFAVAPDTDYWVYVVEVINSIDAPEIYIGQSSENSTPILNKVKIKTTSI